MSQFDQNTAMTSLEEALVPSAGLVDSRTETDNLRLLVDFASLFNFYDRTNTINGNWSPFLLKDPVFLVASIAKTNFQKAYSLFVNTCLQLKKAIANKTTAVKAAQQYIANGFNQLFDQLSAVFQKIERWTHYMQETTMTYNLKTYIINSVKDTYGLILWSLLDVRQQLYNYQKAPNADVQIPGIKNVDIYLYEKYDKKVWSVNKGSMPYWTVLGLPTYTCKDDPTNDTCFYISELTQEELFQSLYATGKKVFAFYSKCISYAGTELKTIQEVPGHFPDTILLRTFTSLLKIYQNQFNGLSQKHLNFYYADILKQAPNTVTPDKVYASSELSKKTTTYQLLKNTIFLAGVDANKQPILFETTNKTSLNPAKIVNAYTLSQPTIVTKSSQPTTANTLSKPTTVHPYHTELYLSKLPPVNVVAKDESGAVKSWKTLGSQLPQTTTANTMACTFGSPMFYLAEANKRTITLDFTFSSSTFTEILKEDTTFYLSTAKAWYAIPKGQVTLGFSTSNYKLPMTIDRYLTMTIDLYETDPAITAFTKNPDGYTSEWPLFKMEFSKFEDLATPPQIEKLTITVHSEEVQNFQLYNDFGQLNSKKPFQLLGGAPKVNQHFMVGNAEAFSKPLKDIQFTLTWNPFDADFDFANYYVAYNNYLNQAYSGNPIDVNALKKLVQQITNTQDSLYTSLTNSEERLFKRAARHTSVTKVVSFIKSNQTSIKETVDKANKKQGKRSDSAPTLIADIQQLNINMLNAIEDSQNTLITKLQQENKVDKTLLTDTETEIKNQIGSYKDQITEKINTAESTALSTGIQEKSGFLSRITNVFKKDPKDLIAKTNDFQFSNTSFSVEFQRLQNGVWEKFEYQDDKGNSVSSLTDENLYFSDTSDTKTLPKSRTFDFPEINITLDEVDPNLQLSPLQLSDTSTNGFLKMKLSEPVYGFGTDLYSKVVQAIALFNAEIIAQKINDKNDKQPLVSPPNIPFVPMVAAFEGEYKAAITYDFSKNETDYPFECFYNTPFANFKVYDSTSVEKIITENTTIGSSPARDDSGTIIPLTGLPLAPTIAPKGQLLLELQDIIVPARVSFYFELARTFTEKVLETKEVSFTYLSTDGWKNLTSIEDGTNNFTCSGIITINIPDDITTVHDTISGTNYWISIGTTDNPDSFPETSFLNTNGFTLQRIVAKDDLSTTVPQIAANIITSPQTAIPEIATTVQPFASFGGKAAETNSEMNSRVSTRLKTKDRLVTTEDFFNTIRLEFPEVYYSKTIYDTTKNQAFSYVLKRVADASDTNAFEPLLSECKELDIQKYIAKRVSPFTKVSVENFELNYIKITANIQVQSDEDVTTVAKEVNDGINIFLAPWITSAQTQITIDTGLNTAQLATFINSYDSILEINSISFQVGTKNFQTGEIDYQDSRQEIIPATNIVLVPSLNNTTKNSLITYTQ
jgi:hypothetical protein